MTHKCLAPRIRAITSGIARASVAAQGITLHFKAAEAAAMMLKGRAVIYVDTPLEFNLQTDNCRLYVFEDMKLKGLEDLTGEALLAHKKLMLDEFLAVAHDATFQRKNPKFDASRLPNAARFEKRRFRK